MHSGIWAFTAPARGLVPALMLGLLISPAAWSAERLWFAGVETSPDNSYAYTGLLMPAFGGNLGEGFVQRYWLDRVSYRYDSDNRTIEAEAPGVEAALGYASPTSRGSVTGLLGILYRDTRLRPDDPDSAARGGQWRIKAQVESTQQLTGALELGLTGSYIFGQQGYWARVRLGRAFGNGRRAGPELVFQGDPDYQVTQAGVFLTGLEITPTVQAGLKAGIRNQRNKASRGYFGVEISALF
ncbi:MAG: cellulose biosynthesis protein BcsS [Gammaproteobacteria bacterium]|nr:cellulose biosynthesis protein BcsS [Gammaproteobacteria bacterium]MCW8839739.1 cellulose biosynthesis protein BcsS [Gammaproteobacteria bacterium]MCW8927664.1 cellulose biosynthesis protein BcsS [Gammaproteobacteria bacterium]MCW8957881.1 cellulose biosynthesis protein BcsS [Gammaproteobacteria bacterium]MCW8972391.1 cellulose biosynthesis protein BcsS [Gammaproteobacteria bacterium]